jgi:hypothetical protein
VISSAQAAEYLDQTLGISVPDLVLTAACDEITACEPAMVAAGYSASTQVLVQCMAVALVAAAGAPRRIASLGAPSGASRSFTNDAKALTALRRALFARDTAGTCAAAVGPDPTAGTMLLVV